jgi:chromosome segregation ATPase
MNPRIQQLIDEIKAKSLALHDDLQNERAKCLNQQLELDLLKVELDDFNIKNENLKTQVSLLQEKLEETKGQVVDNSQYSSRNNEEIDELVREIEYCINQLRK